MSDAAHARWFQVLHEFKDVMARKEAVAREVAALRVTVEPRAASSEPLAEEVKKRCADLAAALWAEIDAPAPVTPAPAPAASAPRRGPPPLPPFEWTPDMDEDERRSLQMVEETLIPENSRKLQQMRERVSRGLPPMEELQLPLAPFPESLEMYFYETQKKTGKKRSRVANMFEAAVSDPINFNPDEWIGIAEAHQREKAHEVAKLAAEYIRKHGRESYARRTQQRECSAEEVEEVLGYRRNILQVHDDVRRMSLALSQIPKNRARIQLLADLDHRMSDYRIMIDTIKRRTREDLTR